MREQHHANPAKIMKNVNLRPAHPHLIVIIAYNQTSENERTDSSHSVQKLLHRPRSIAIHTDRKEGPLLEEMLNETIQDLRLALG